MIVGAGIFIVIGAWAYLTRAPGTYNLDPQAVRGAFRTISGEIYTRE